MEINSNVEGNMSYCREIFLSLALGAVPMVGHAEIYYIERYLTGEQGAQVAQEISDLRADLNERFKNAGALSKLIGTCPRTSSLLPSDTFLLLTSDNPNDRTRFFEEFGAHLGLPMAFDPANIYHHQVLMMRWQPKENNLYLRDDLSDAQREQIGNAFLKMLNEDYLQPFHGFWPPELSSENGTLTRDDLAHIYFGMHDDLLRNIISETLMPRAELTRDLLADELAVCSADSAEDTAATQRARSYMQALP